MRIRKYSSSGAASTVLFAYDQAGHLLGEYDKKGAPLREYVWFGSTPVAMFTPDPAGASNPSLVYFIHADHLDTPRVVVDRDNKLRWRWMAEPFGTTAPETNPGGLGAFTVNLRLPGQYADVETGLNYNMARDYDSSLGRYIQSDPIGLKGGINTYGYVAGNPLSYVDPNGQQVAQVVTFIPVIIIGCYLTPACRDWANNTFNQSNDWPDIDRSWPTYPPAPPGGRTCPPNNGGPNKCYEQCKHLLPSPSGDLQASEYRACYRRCIGSLPND